MSISEATDIFVNAPISSFVANIVVCEGMFPYVINTTSVVLEMSAALKYKQETILRLMSFTVMPLKRRRRKYPQIAG